jgi:hypothetical protein
LSARSVAAAQAVARAHGVACDEAVLLAGGSNALVHLKPAPVVARVMTGTALLHDDPEPWLAREVAVGAFLAGTGLVVAPTDLLPPGPHERDGLWMTMWEFVPHGVRALEARELGRSLRALHAALADYRGDLPPLSGIRDWLAELRPAPALARKLEELTPAVFESSLPAQPLHGDVSLGNLLPTDRGLRWNDLEDVCCGPVAWDVAGLVSSARARGHSEEFVEELLAAYGAPVEGLEACLEAHAVYAAIWRAFSRR